MKKIGFEVAGSYSIYDEDNKLLGKSLGYSIKKRYINYTSYLNNNAYIISKRPLGYFLLMKDEQVEAIIKFNWFSSSFIIKCSDDMDYHMTYNSLDSTHKIHLNGKNLGVISASNWMRNDVVISLSDLQDVDYIFAGAIAYGYAENIPSLRYFLKSNA